MFLTSILSAVALTGLLLKSITFILMFTFSGRRAPFHLLGLKALMGVNAKIFEFKGIIGPWADKL